jgi:hypothetical protein
MGIPIRIVAGGIELEAELNDSPTARAVIETLPLSAPGNRWGEEIYFEIPVVEGLAPDASADVGVGDLGYWPPGKAFCIFFGPTPMSTGDQPRAASPVNPIGRVLDDAKRLTAHPDGGDVRLEKK